MAADLERLASEFNREPYASVIEAYNALPHTPEFLSQTHQAIWRYRGERVGVSFDVVPCPYTHEEIIQLETNNLRLGYLPKEISTQETRYVLGEMFPRMQSYSVREGNTVSNYNRVNHGWFDYEAAIKSPYRGADGWLWGQLNKANRSQLNLNEYIVAGQDSKLFTGKYLDEDETWARLNASELGNDVIARFYKDGFLDIRGFVDPNNRGHFPEVVGARSSGVRKA